MRKLIMIIPFMLGYNTVQQPVVEPMVELNVKDVVVDVTPPNVVDSLDLTPLVNAMIMVESSGNDSAYNHSERAVGCLQIRPIMLKECNRILRLSNSDVRYNLSDRWDRGKSIEIFYIVSNYHHKEGVYEEIARAWNGGPKWSEKSGTKRYWNKVQNKLKEDEHSNHRFTEV